MFNGLQGMLIAGGLSGIVALGIGYKMGADHEANRCQKIVAAEVQKVKDAAADLIDHELALRAKAETEAAFAKGEVAKVNAQIATQLAEQKALLLADQAAREEAAKKSDAAAAQAARQSRETAAKFQAALEALKNDPDQCAHAPVSPDVKRMLDDLLKGSAP